MFLFQIYVIIGLIIFAWSMTQEDLVESLSTAGPKWGVYPIALVLTVILWPWYLFNWIKGA